MPQIPKFEAAILDPSGGLRSLVGGEAEKLVTTTVSNGGCLTARFLLKRPVKLSYNDLGFNYDVRISDSEGVFWRGQLRRARAVLEDDTEYIEVTARNAVASNQYYQSTTLGSGSIASAFATVLSDLMPRVTSSNLLITAGGLSGALSPAKRRAFDILNLLASYQGLQWGVWPDGTNAALQLLLEARPTTPAYFVHIDDFIGTLGFDDAEYANSQSVLYNAGTAWATATDAAAIALVGDTIQGEVIEAPDLTNATDAASIAASALAIRKQLSISAEDGKIKSPWAVTDTTGLPVALHRIRAGRNLAINGMIPSGQAGTFTFDRNLAYIAGTSYDDVAGEVSFTLGSFAQTVEGLLAKLIRATQI